MGGKISKKLSRVPLRITEQYYIDGISRIENQDIDNIYVALIMKMNYNRKKCLEYKTEPAVFVTLYSNTNPLKPYIPLILPSTIDFLSGYCIRNNSIDLGTVYIRYGETIIESFEIIPNNMIGKHTNRLYMFMIHSHASGDRTWNIYTESSGIEISCECGILHNSVMNLYMSCIKDYRSTTGSTISYSDLTNLLN
jgi:hypothetical protein